jgi:ATP-dependent exoDNAse (exonuclease V) alpha subunit
MLYTGITRARDLLFICGSKDDLRESGGKELLKKIVSV